MPAASYKACTCGADCWAEGTNDNEPCWGEVSAIDEWYSEDDYGWIHGCEGHDGDMYCGKSYRPEPAPQ